MKTQIFLIFLIFSYIIITSSFSQTCTGNTLRNINETCNESIGDKCLVGSFCYKNKCVVNTVDESCSTDSDCYAFGPVNSIYCNTGTKLCRLKYTDNQPCLYNEDCFSNKCVNSDIAKKYNGRCSGLDYDSTCNPLSFATCKSDAYCNPDTKKCTNKISDGSNCGTLYHKYNQSIFADRTIICGPGYVCDHNEEDINYSNQNCVLYSNRNEGEQCSNDFACKQDLYCDKKTHKCSAFPSIDLATHASFYACSNRSECPSARMFCNCSDTSLGIPNKGRCRSLIQLSCALESSYLAGCMKNQKCYPSMMNRDLWDKQSCLARESDGCSYYAERLACCYEEGHSTSMLLPEEFKEDCLKSRVETYNVFIDIALGVISLLMILLVWGASQICLVFYYIRYFDKNTIPVYHILKVISWIKKLSGQEIDEDDNNNNNNNNNNEKSKDLEENLVVNTDESKPQNNGNNEDEFSNKNEEGTELKTVEGSEKTDKSDKSEKSEKKEKKKKKKRLKKVKKKRRKKKKDGEGDEDHHHHHRKKKNKEEGEENDDDIL